MTRTPPPYRDASSRFIWPPTIYGTAAIVAGILFWYFNAPLLPRPPAASARIAGIAICLAGTAIALMAEIAFLRAGTATLPISPTSAIVTTGIYRWTRNPMYLGMSLFLAGLGLFLNSLWFLLVLPIAIFAVTKLAIEPEERYLAAKFGQSYTNYAEQVRRWL